jgi:hypothetical protein
MAIAINGSGTISGVSVGGLPDGIVDSGTLATNSVDSAQLVSGSVDDAHMAAMAASKLTGALPAISGASLTGLITPKMKIFDASYAFSGAPGTQTISGVGFTPDAMYGEWGTGNSTTQGPCRFWAVNRDVTSFSTGTGAYMSCWQHNEQQTAGTWEFKSNYLIWEASWNNDFRATITTWGSDGITITYTETGTGSHTSMNMQFVMFKFS